MTYTCRPAARAARLLSCAGSLALILAGQTAFADTKADATAADATAADAAATTTPAPTPGGLGEIVVTAQKRETSVQKAPLAITAISAAGLAQNHVTDAVGLNGLVPSLVLTTSEGFERNVAIRGVGFNVPQNDAAQPSVSYHIDGLYIANPVSLNTGFLDVNHVEVVRGPQGTVYGQNSTGGTVNLITNQPQLGKWTGNATLSGGTYDDVEFEGALNVPIGDTLAVRGAFTVISHSGFAKATEVPGTNGDYGLSDQHEVHGRVSVLWAPAPNVSLTLRAEIDHQHNHETEGKSIYDPNPDAWSESSDWPGKFEYLNEIYSGTLNWDLGFAKLKALGSYQLTRQNGSVNEDGLDVALSQQYYGYTGGTYGYEAVHDIEYLYHHSQSRTGELDLASPTGRPIEWIVGGFYLSTTYHVAYDQYAIDSFPDGTPGSLQNQLFPQITDPEALGFEGANGEYYYPYFYNFATLTRESYSLYGQVTWHASDRLRFSGGLRYTHDHNTDDGIDYAADSFSAVQSNKAWTGKVGAEYDIARKTMAYATFSTGFKPGGGNISAFPIDLGYTYAPETVRAYELGLKTTTPDNKLRFNLAGFYYDYHNTQFEAEDAVAYQGGVANIPKLHIYGVEAEMNAILPLGFRFDGNMTAETSKITSHYTALDNVNGYNADKTVFANYPDGGGGACLFDSGAASCYDADIAARAPLYKDVYGNQAPNLPHITATGTLANTQRLDDGSEVTLSIQGQYRSSYINSVYGDEVVNGVHVYRSPAYTLWNLFLGYQPQSAHWNASVAVKNLFNQAAVLGQFTNQFGGEITRQYANPRQVIASVSYKF